MVCMSNPVCRQEKYARAENAWATHGVSNHIAASFPAVQQANIMLKTQITRLERQVGIGWHSIMQPCLTALVGVHAIHVCHDNPCLVA